MTEAHLHQRLAGRGLARLDGQPHAVGEAHEGDAEIADLAALRHLAGRAEVGVGPGLGDRGRVGRERRGLGLGEHRLEAGDAAGGLRRGRQEDDRPLAGELRTQNRVDAVRSQPFHRGLEEVELLLRAEVDLAGLGLVAEPRHAVLGLIGRQHEAARRLRAAGLPGCC